MTLIQELRDTVKPVAVRARCRVIRRRLRRELGTSASLVADALGYAIGDNVAIEEKAWFDRIESLRDTLLRSDDSIEIQDFGAVSSELTLDSETMKQGRVIVRTVGDMCASSAKPPHWAALLFGLVRAFKPESGLELGTCLGVSACYQAAAMQLNGSGRLVTLEGSPALAALSRQNVSSLGLENVEVVEGGFHETLDATLEQCPPVDYAFIDGHHHEQSTLEYFEKILKRSADRACLVFDDISWSRGMRRAWDRIAGHSAVAVAADLRSVGVAIIER